MLVELADGKLMYNETGEIVGYVKPDGTTQWADGFAYEMFANKNRYRL